MMCSSPRYPRFRIDSLQQVAGSAIGEPWMQAIVWLTSTSPDASLCSRPLHPASWWQKIGRPVQLSSHWNALIRSRYSPASHSHLSFTRSMPPSPRRLAAFGDSSLLSIHLECWQMRTNQKRQPSTKQATKPSVLIPSPGNQITVACLRSNHPGHDTFFRVGRVRGVGGRAVAPRVMAVMGQQVSWTDNILICSSISFPDFSGKSYHSSVPRY